MAIKDVCRLCLTTDDLLWVFDKHFDSASDMKDVIHVTTGVEITTKDIVSQKVCGKCCQVTIKMFEFRKTSLKNDQYLKDQCKIFLKEKKMKIPNTQVTIKTEIKKEHVSIKNETKTVEGKQENKPTYKIHPSVRELFKIYPEIKVPTVCLKYNITPCVSMTLDQVEQYFRSRKLDIHQHTKLALRAGRIATKKTSSILKTKNSIQFKSSVTKTIPKSERNEVTPKTEDTKETSFLKMKETHPKVNGGITSKDKIHSHKKGESSNSIKNHESTHKVTVSEEHQSVTSKDKIHSHKKGESSNSIKNHDSTHKVTVSEEHQSVTSKDKIHSHKIGESTNSIKNHESTHKVIAKEEQHQSKKRKIPEDGKIEKKEFKKTNFVESLGLTPKVDPPSGVLSYIANKSLPLHICEICNSVQYSAKDLRRHQNKHLRCQFCKIKFRSLETKKGHIESSCVIKNMMNNVPDVILEKVEFNPSIRIKYPEAFESFSPLANKIKENNSIAFQNHVNSAEQITEADDCDNERDVKQIIEHKKHSIGLHKQTPDLNPCEVIILSDDEEPLISASNVVNSGISSVPCTPQAVPIPTAPAPAQQNTIVNDTALIPQEDNIVYNTVSIVRPDIKIKGNASLDLIDIRMTDTKVLKELLTNYRPIELHVVKNTQTDLPSNNSIFIKPDEKSAELRGLKPQLYVYKISIIMKYGAFHANYNYSLQPKPPKRLRLWNDLTAIDIKPSKIIPYKPASSDNVTVQNSTILPSTATYNSTGVISLSSPTATSKFIRVNASSLSPVTTANSLPPTNVVTANPIPQITTPSTPSTSTVPASDTEASTSSAGQQFGTIRVKNLWDLT